MSIADIATITIRLKPQALHDGFYAGWATGLQRGIAEGIRQAAAHLHARLENRNVAALEEVYGELIEEAERVDDEVWP